MVVVVVLVVYGGLFNGKPILAVRTEAPRKHKGKIKAKRGLEILLGLPI